MTDSLNLDDRYAALGRGDNLQFCAGANKWLDFNPKVHVLDSADVWRVKPKEKTLLTGDPSLFVSDVKDCIRSTGAEPMHSFSGLISQLKSMAEGYCAARALEAETQSITDLNNTVVELKRGIAHTGAQPLDTIQGLLSQVSNICAGFVLACKHDTDTYCRIREMLDSTEEYKGLGGNELNVLLNRLSELVAKYVELRQRQVPEETWEKRYHAMADVNRRQSARVTGLRSALIDIASIVGGEACDDVSDEFLLGVPNEVEAVLTRLRRGPTLSDEDRKLLDRVMGIFETVAKVRQG